MDYNDDQLWLLALENNEEAKNILYDKYKYIVDILMKKYHNIALKYDIDLKELEQEAYYAFSDAINNYRQDKNTSLKTFISLCINRRLMKIVKKYSNQKAQFLNSTFSLDYNYDEDGLTLQDKISDDYQFEPLYNLTIKEDYEELLHKIKEVLSESEYEIYNYMLNEFDYQTIALILNKSPKQIDNAMQRIKKKIRDIIKE